MRSQTALLCLTLAACGSATVPSPHQPRSAALDATNGDNLNGDNLNGDNLNGDNLNGDNLNGLGLHVVSVNLAGARHRDAGPFDSVALQGSQLVGTIGNHTVGGADLAGSTFSGTSDTGQSVSLSIAAVSQDPAPNDDTWNYRVTYWDPKALAWKPLCLDATFNPIDALALDGTWNYAQGVAGGGSKTVDGQHFTFACKTVGAVGKCAAVVNYRPWRTLNGVSLAGHHQACVRLLRADFCGNGTPYTQNGNRVDIYDGIGVQVDTEPLWFFEAEWDQNGARCFNPVNRSKAYVPCYSLLADLTCGQPSHFQSGTLLMDKTPTSGLTP